MHQKWFNNVKDIVTEKDLLNYLEYIRIEYKVVGYSFYMMADYFDPEHHTYVLVYDQEEILRSFDKIEVLSFIEKHAKLVSLTSPK